MCLVLISGIMLLVSIGMLIIGMVQKVENSILYLFFGGFGAFMTIDIFLILIIDIE